MTKAQRLLCEGRVEPDVLPASVFRVHGDHGVYTVVVGAHVALCTCPSPARCSHIEAAVEWVNADERTRVLLDAALAHRKETDRAVAEAALDRLTVA